MHVHRARIFLVCVLLLGAVIAVLAAPGCSDGPTIGFDCNHPVYNHKDRDGTSDKCCDLEPCPCECVDSAMYPCPAPDYVPSNFKDCHTGTDGGTDGGTSSCAGECVPIPPPGWSGPDLLWFGSEAMAPACPAQAPVAGDLGHADLDAPPVSSCPACACSASSGTCAPPVDFDANYAACPGGLTSTKFDPPVPWDGACTSNEPIAAVASCNGPTSCVRSLTAGPVVLTDQGCSPSSLPPVDPPPPSWKTLALGCAGTPTPWISCDDPVLTCVPSAPPSLGFRRCIHQSGDQACPASYPDKQPPFYSGFDDQRRCTACACGPSAGSLCTAQLDVSKGGDCHGSAFTADGSPLPVAITSLGPACFELPAGVALGSKQVTNVMYEAGTCTASGGDPTGMATPTGASTFCCLVGA